ncbi:MAG: family N-acetyltransferase [Frankiales bacterium]|nr:family N-acetyltransferase [Frankiales bacterium]
MTLTEITSAAEVLVATGHDPFARASLRRDLTRGWVWVTATMWMGVDGAEHVPYLSALGEPSSVGLMIGEVLGELPHRQRVTLPRGSGAHLPAWVGLEGTHWDFRYLLAPPPEQPGEERVRLVADLDQVRALLAVAHPTASVLPGDPHARAWVGVDGPAGLLACAADTSSSTGVGHLSAIAVHPEARGRGLGKAVTAALARRQFGEGRDLVTLGMYADNGAGRVLYDALGFADEHQFTSGPLLVRSRW